MDQEGESSEESIQSRDIQESSQNKHNRWRNLAGFWLLGLCNNFGYVIMLSAAHDLLKENGSQNGTNSTDLDSVLDGRNRSGKLVPECNHIGTGAILLADILPALIIKLTAPFYMQSIPYGIRVVIVVALNAASFVTVAMSATVWLDIIGVAMASLASGFGEITFLGLASHFNKNVVSTWSSGTGGSGIFGALLYAGLTALRVTPQVTLLIMEVIPVLMALSYWLLLVRPPEVTGFSFSHSTNTERSQLLPEQVETGSDVNSLTFVEKLHLLKPLLKYMIPLTLVYFAEYFINQALYELIYYQDIWLPEDQQYRWYQVTYQLGVFLSRSSVNVIQINQLWLMPILQFANVTVLMLQVFLKFMPNIWIVFAIILFEGLIGGAAYVNTFYKIVQEVRKEHCEFSMGLASLSDTLGIAVSGVVALPVHNLICTL